MLFNLKTSEVQRSQIPDQFNSILL